MGFWKTTRDVTFKTLVVVGTAKVIIATAPIAAAGAAGATLWNAGKNALGNSARRKIHEYDKLSDDRKTKALTKQVTNTVLGQVGGNFTHGITDHIRHPNSH